MHARIYNPLYTSDPLGLEHRENTTDVVPDDPEDADADLDADLCRTQILTADDQSECDSLRNTPVLRWADKPNVGSYLLYVAHDKEMTNPVYDLNQDGFFTPIILSQPMWTPAAALPDSQADTAYYYRVVPCSYQKCEALSHAEHSFDKLSRKVVLNPVRHTPVGGTAPIACPPASTPPNHPVCENDVTLSWQDFRTTEKSLPDVGTPLQTPGRTEARSYVVQTAEDPSFSRVVIETHRGRPDDVHVLQHDLPGGSGLLASAGGRRVGQQARLERDRGLRQEVAASRPAGPGRDPERPRGPFLLVDVIAVRRAVPHRGLQEPRHRGQRRQPGLPCRDRPVADGVADRPAAGAAADAQRGRPLRLAGPAHRRRGPHRRLERLGHFRVVEPSATQTSPAGQRLGRAVRRAVHVVGRARRRELPLRAAGGRHPDQRRADHHACARPGRRSWPIADGDWEWRVIPIDASGNNLTPSNWRAASRSRTPSRRPPGWRSAAPAGSARRSRSPPRRRGTSAPRSPRPTSGSGHHARSAARPGQTYTVTVGRPRQGHHGEGDRHAARLHDRHVDQQRRSPGISGDAPVAVTDVTISGTGKVGTSLTRDPARLGQRPSRPRPTSGTATA